MLPYEKENNGYKYILIIIDTFSKFARAVPVKTKNGKAVTTAMESVLQKGRVPKNLEVDRGKEFYNSHFENLTMFLAIGTRGVQKDSIRF